MQAVWRKNYPDMSFLVEALFVPRPLEKTPRNNMIIFM